MSAFPDASEYFYPPGVYWEQRKESIEFWEMEDGERMDCKVIEVHPYLTRSLGMGKSKSKDAPPA